MRCHSLAHEACAEHAGGVVEKEGIALRVDDRNARKRLGDVASDSGFGHVFKRIENQQNTACPLLFPLLFRPDAPLIPLRCF